MLDRQITKIQHCSFTYQCPKTWDALLETNVDSIRYCDQCERNVFLSQSVDQAHNHAARGECVAIPVQLTEQAKRQLEHAGTVVGMMSMPPYRKEDIAGLYLRELTSVADFYGIDGCPAGWFFVGIDREDAFHFGVLERFSDVTLFADQAVLTLVDIPVGLVSAGTSERVCDKQARKLIKPRGSSVFPAPARAALSEQGYREGSEANFNAVGRRLSAQSWAIVPKIREVDQYMRSANIQHKLREMHPEVAFWALNDRAPLQTAKKQRAGALERLDVLSRHFAGAEECYRQALDTYKRKDVAADDILDAMVGAVTARQHPRLATVPADPVRDEEGLLMEMVYALV
jgi:predicted RNase H-like nuclease